VKHFRVKVSTACSWAILSVAFIGVFGFFNDAKAICSTTACWNGLSNCFAYCDAHNKTPKSQTICANKCGDYWQNGASIGRDPSNPSGPPRVSVGQVPPTTVSPPTHRAPPVNPVKPVSVSDPSNPTAGSQPVILTRRKAGGNEHKY
jgi:hypothetical protein